MFELINDILLGTFPDFTRRFSKIYPYELLNTSVGNVYGGVETYLNEIDSFRIKLLWNSKGTSSFIINLNFSWPLSISS